MNNKEIFYFTGKCLALDDHPEFATEIIDKCRNNLIDWQQFVTLCSNHLILPVIYLKFKYHKLLEYLPEELSDHLYEIYKLNLSRNKNILKQIKEITTILNKNNIYPVFLKGGGNLLDNIYSDIGERIMGDIDFLVSEEEYLPAAKIMEAEGYSKVKATPTYKDIRYFKHYPRLAHPDYEAVIEIHQKPVVTKYESWFNSKIITSEKKTLKKHLGCYVPADQHKIMHNFIHSQLSNKGNLSGIISLKDIYDLYLFSKRFPIEKTIAIIKTKQKASAYFSFARLILDLDESFYPETSFSYQLLLKKHNLNLSSPIFYNSVHVILFLAERQYINQITKAFYSKKMRQSILMRISNRSWYNDHLQLYTRFLKENKN